MKKPKIDSTDALTILILFSVTALLGCILLIAGLVTTNFWLICGGIGVLVVALSGDTFILIRNIAPKKPVQPAGRAATEAANRDMLSYANIMSTVHKLAAESPKVQGMEKVEEEKDKPSPDKATKPKTTNTKAATSKTTKK